MKVQNRANPTGQELSILTATWTMACNDENPVVIFKDVQYRLGLPDDFDLRGLVHRHGELFRMGIPQQRLKELQEKMRLNRDSRPSWIRSKPNESDQLAEIDELTVDHAFRSQLRVKNGAPRSPIEILDWGLQHIERSRKASLEARQESRMRLQLWSIIVLNVLNVLVTLLVALLK